MPEADAPGVRAEGEHPQGARGQGVLATLASKLDPTQPFALPEGTVRACLALVALGSLCASFIMYKWAPDALVAIVGTVIGFYFGARQR